MNSKWHRSEHLRHSNVGKGRSFGLVLVPASHDNVLQAARRRRWNGWTASFGYSVCRLNRCHGCKGNLTGDKLPQNNSKTVYITVGRIWFMPNDFWSHVSIGTCEFWPGQYLSSPSNQFGASIEDLPVSAVSSCPKLATLIPKSAIFARWSLVNRTFDGFKSL